MHAFSDRWPWWIATVVGAALPLYFFVPWLIQDLGNFSLFVQQGTTTPAAQTVMADVVWAALVFSAYVILIILRTRAWRLLFCVLLTWTIGLSCGLPLYFALRD